MDDTPGRDEAQKKLQADLLDFVAQDLQERAKRDMTEIAGRLADSVNARLEGAIKASTRMQADVVAAQVIARLKVDMPEMFEPRSVPPSPAPVSPSEVLSADDEIREYVRAVRERSQKEKAEEAEPRVPASTTRLLATHWLALSMLILLLLGGAFSAKLYLIQKAQLANERMVAVNLQNDLNQTCGIHAEIDQEAKVLDDSYKTFCAGSQGRTRDPVCRFSEKLKRWAAAAPSECGPRLEIPAR